MTAFHARSVFQARAGPRGRPFQTPFDPFFPRGGPWEHPGDADSANFAYDFPLPTKVKAK